jgi:hypothetical protein
MAKASHAMPPVNAPAAVIDANCGPCSNPTNSKIGPVTTGKPDSQPAMPGPQRRPASVMPPISAGTSVSLNARIESMIEYH